MTGLSSAKDNVSTITVELGARSYDILIGRNLVADAGNLVKPYLKRPRAVIVTDKTVNELHAQTLEESLAFAGIAHDKVVLSPGEKTKSLQELERLLNDLLEMGVERNDTLIALGGGVVGDITGFAAAILLRGINFIQIPTTLLAQVDSSVGGKTGVNTVQGKNLIGAFHQPRLVLADIGTLDTLPLRDFLAGYAEVVKYGLINDADFFGWLENNGTAMRDGNFDARRYAVKISCRAKSRIVAADEREGGVRALLNLGHTFGHALEGMTGYGPDLLHGEAVAVGMAMAFDLSSRLGLCPPEDTERVHAHLRQMGLPDSPSALAHEAQHWNSETMRGFIALDKKVSEGRFTFILARAIGQAFITQDVAPESLNALLEESLAA
ncbi:MAG TPA: 3-dehydroquinate synthase [Sneathiellales bacterium]|nr:3-dehydroquinate synthase [Sneathiellales bacterium]